jgi:hypothetical protein
MKRHQWKRINADSEIWQLVCERCGMSITSIDAEQWNLEMHADCLLTSEDS